MKGTLFSADFVKDSSGNLRLLELNTDTSIISSEVPHLEWESFIDLLDTNSITKLDVIYKPAIHQEFVTYLQYAIASSSLSLDEFNLHSENISTIYPASVTDETDRFILRIAYDESSIFDSMYCKSRLETFKLFTDSNSGSFVSPFYYSSSLYEINTLEYQINPNNIPDVAIKDIDEQQNPISFYKIGSEIAGESDVDRWNWFIQINKYEDKLIEQYNYDTSSLVDGKVTSIRSFNIVYGGDLETINLHSYKIPSIFELPDNLDSEVTQRYTNRLATHHYYEFATNYVKIDSSGMLSTHKILMEDGTYKPLIDTKVGDDIQSFFISGSPQLEDDLDIINWSFEGNNFPTASYLTSSTIVYKDVEQLSYGAMVEYVVDGDSIFSGMSKRYLVYDSGSNHTKFKHATEIEAGTDYFYDSNSNLIQIDESNLYVTTDTEVSMVTLDVEDTDTYIISGSTDFHSLVTHNAPCFVGGTKITLFGGEYKNVEDIKVDDVVLSFNFTNENVEPQRVVGIGSKKVNETVKYTFIDGSTLESTLDHPLYSKENGWISANPTYTLSVYNLTTAKANVGDKIFKQDGSELEITSIVISSNPTIVYNVNVVEQNHNFFANEFLVHNRRCFAGGTKVTMADGSEKNIEDVVNGDEVLSLSETGLILEPKKVINTNTPIHTDMVKYVFSNQTEIICTFDHPFYVDSKELASYNPFLTNKHYELDKEVRQIKVGDMVYTSNGVSRAAIKDIIELDKKDTQTYIITVEDNHNFFANKILVHNK